MAFAGGHVALAGYFLLMASAALVDLRRLVIPNSVVVALCLLWLPHMAATGAPMGAVVESAACAAIVFVGGALLFAGGLVGGGDVKLFAAAALWAGAAAVPRLLMLTALVGGALALLFLSPLGPRLAALRDADPASAGSGVLPGGRTPIPYGIAIAGAALIVTIRRCFG